MKRFRNAFVLFSMTLIAAGTQMGGCGDSDDDDGGGESSGLTLFAGSMGGSGYMDGIGSDARFNGPHGITADGTNLYIADSDNNTIRKMVIATGEVTTFAGTAGVFGSFDSSNFPGSAYFRSPHGITTDGTNLYVSDSGNQTIRKIVIATRWVSTIAGTAGVLGSADGTGGAAQFEYPRGITIDDSGNLYVADSQNHTIRKIVIDTGVVTTLAGEAGVSGINDDPTGTSAHFNGPTDVVFSGTDLYVTDTGNHTIRKIIVSSGAVTTLAGSAGLTGSTDDTGTLARFNNPLGLTTDGSNLYVCEDWNGSIRKVDISTGEVTTFAGQAGWSESYPNYYPQQLDGIGTTARFNFLRKIVFDGTNLYVVDSTTVRKIDPNSTEVTTVAGTFYFWGDTDGTGNGTAAKLSYPEYIASDGTNLYVVQWGIIKKIVISTGLVTTLAGNWEEQGSVDGIGGDARFEYPKGIATDGTNVYVADSGNHTIRKIVIATREVTTFAGKTGESGHTDGTGSVVRLDGPTALTIDGTNLYVTSGCSIRKISTLSGLVTTIAGKGDTYGTTDGIGTSARFHYYGKGLTTDGTNLYVADTLNYTIRKIVLATLEVTTLAGTAGSSGSQDHWCCERFNEPGEIDVVGTNLYVADTKNHTIRKIDLTTGVVTTPIGSAGLAGGLLGPLPSVLNGPSGIEIVSGKIYISSSYESSILVAPQP